MPLANTERRRFTKTMLVSDLINEALTLLGVLSQGESILDPGQVGNLTFCFNRLNGMVDTWLTQKLLVYAILRQTFNLNPAQDTYQIGPGAPDWNTGTAQRPIKIETASVLLFNNPALPLEISMSVATVYQWQDVPVKLTPSAFPLEMYYLPTFPIGKVSVVPVPTQGGNQVILGLWQQINRFGNVGDTVSFPPGYEEMLYYNLAVRLRPAFGKPLDPEITELALSSIEKVKSINSIIPDMKCDPGVLSTRSRQFNWLTGDFSR